VGNVDGPRRLLLRAQQFGVEGIPQLILLETHTGSIARGATRSSAAAQSVGGVESVAALIPQSSPAVCPGGLP
jgi:hypothetical protein